MFKKKENKEIKDEVLVEEPVEGAYCKEGIAHYITQLDLNANPDEEIGNIGDLIYIPFTAEQAEEYKIALEKENKEDDEEDDKDNEEKEEIEDRTRECTCGRLVMLPNEGEGPTKCDCGVEHIW